VKRYRVKAAVTPAQIWNPLPMAPLAARDARVLLRTSVVVRSAVVSKRVNPEPVVPLFLQALKGKVAQLV